MSTSTSTRMMGAMARRGMGMETGKKEKERMLLFVSHSNSPFINLATEEWYYSLPLPLPLRCSLSLLF